ncbi:MAG: Ig domain-containing protein [Roseburia sp.]
MGEYHGWTELVGDNIATLNNYNHSDVVGKPVSSTATVKEGYQFEGWYDAAGNPVSTDKLSDNGTTLSYTTTGDATYYARFSETVTQSYTENLTQEGEILELSLDDLPEDVDEEDIIWNSSNPDIVTVDEDGNVVVVGNGTCTITATTADGSFSFIWTITVNIPSGESSTEDDTESDTESNTENSTETTTEPGTETNKENTAEQSTESNWKNTTEQSTEANTENVTDKTDTDVNDASISGEPQTGDRSHLALWFTLLLLSMTVLVGVVFRRRSSRL